MAALTRPAPRPQGARASRYVAARVARLGLGPESIVLDVPTGYGRHAALLGELGCFVVAVDLDPVGFAGPHRRGCAPVVADASRPLPFKPASFDCVLIVHFPTQNVIELARPLLRAGGHLVFESFGGQGGNWASLPAPGVLREALRPQFTILDYEERPVGPAKSSVSVKFVARAG